jgi:hypothetical protein
MRRETIRCRYCDGEIGAHWQLFNHMTCTPPRGDVSAEERKRQGWQLEKQLNRIGRSFERWGRV